MTKKQPRGLRNNNPGNIEYNPKTKWQGLSNPPVEPEGRFARFKDPVYGIRAIARTLITYFDKHDCDTVMKVLSRWAPAVENDTKSYARAVAFDLGCGVNDPIDVHEYRVLRALVCGIIEHENGLQSYKEAYTDAQIDKALVLAGVEPPKKPLAKSRTVQGAGVAATGVTLTAATEVVSEVQKQVEPLVPYAESMKLVFLVVALVGIGLTVWARLDDRRKGLR